jgi:alanine racemase
MDRMTARLDVDLDLFAGNLRTVRETIAPAEHMLVVKDDAYGHGLVPIVAAAWAQGVRWFGAFDIPTGLAVRDEAPEARVFSWLVGSVDDACAAVDADLDLGVGDVALLEDVAIAAGEVGRPARVHLKIDTGLHRNGIRPEEWDAAVVRAAELEQAASIVVEGIWSHIAEASDAEDDAARAAFDDAMRRAERASLTPRLRHLSASAASFARPEFRYDLARVGAFAYGIRPAGGPGEDELGILPIAALRADVQAVVDGRAVLGYGALDGFPSSLAGRTQVGTPAGVRDIVSVDLDTITVEGWTDAAPGQTATVWGGDAPSATDHAERIGSIGEELAVRLSPLVPRVYRAG